MAKIAFMTKPLEVNNRNYEFTLFHQFYEGIIKP